jgi:hypothetical protein
MSVYGQQDPGSSDYPSFQSVLGDPNDSYGNSSAAPWGQLAALAPTKPIGLFEVGVIARPYHSTAHQQKTGWIRSMFNAVATGPFNAPGRERIKLVQWWNEAWDNGDGISDMTINNHDGSQNAYYQALRSNNAYYRAAPSFACTTNPLVVHGHAARRPRQS